MNEYDKLIKILSKKSLTFTELRKLINNERVVSVENKNSDSPFFYRYDVRLDNDELYFVHVRKTLDGLKDTFFGKKF